MSPQSQTSEWRGYWPAAPTPFTAEGDIDFAAWADLLQFYVRGGVHGVLVNGTTGEWFSQSAAERAALLDAAVSVVGGAVPVIAGVSAFTGQESATLASKAAESGADGVLATPPPYARPTDEEMIAYYTRIADSSQLPLMIYNWPRGVGVDMDLPLLRRLIRIPGVAALKESSGDADKVLRVFEELGGQVRMFGPTFTPQGMSHLQQGHVHGNVDGGALGAPFAIAFYEAVWSGRLEEAEDHRRTYERLVRSLLRSDYSGVFASPTAQIKAAMRLLGQPGGFVRDPLLDIVDEAVLGALGDALASVGLEPK